MTLSCCPCHESEVMMSVIGIQIFRLNVHIHRFLSVSCLLFSVAPFTLCWAVSLPGWLLWSCHLKHGGWAECSSSMAYYSNLCRLVSDTQVEYGGMLNADTCWGCLYWLLHSSFYWHFPCDPLQGKTHLDLHEKWPVAITTSKKICLPFLLKYWKNDGDQREYFGTCTIIKSSHHDVLTVSVH